MLPPLPHTQQKFWLGPSFHGTALNRQNKDLSHDFPLAGQGQQHWRYALAEQGPEPRPLLAGQGQQHGPPAPAHCHHGKAQPLAACLPPWWNPRADLVEPADETKMAAEWFGTNPLRQ
eukprot:4341183-Alexandrium_andersonii.AAC.1